jgi:hypothetical protein
MSNVAYCSHGAVSLDFDCICNFGWEGFLTQKCDSWASLSRALLMQSGDFSSAKLEQLSDKNTSNATDRQIASKMDRQD